MKKLILFAVLCSSCSLFKPAAPTCPTAPESIYGTKLMSCEAVPGQNVDCCSYSHRIDLGGETNQCVFILCQTACQGWDLIVGNCGPIEPVKDPNDSQL
jgi:hypothetical protein